MWPYYEELLRRPVPRYTSYPTAAEFKTQIGPRQYRKALAKIARGSDISLYIHIPFCEQICWYCGCNTAKANKPARLSAYLDALHEEIRMVAALLPSGCNIARIAFGGGSPNAINPVDFARIIDHLTIDFGALDPLISVELDPRQFGLGWLRAVAAVGVDYVSLGVQTFDPTVQAAIGRVQPYATIAELVEELRLTGVRSINFDLMYGLPGQDDAILADTIDQAIGLHPDRIALFGYAHLPSILPRQRQIDDSKLPGMAERFKMAELGYDRLTAAGYVPIGFDHFALPDDPLAKAAVEGRLHRNFQGFTDDGSDIVIGLGASAISHLPGLYAQNAKNSGQYREALSGGELPVERGIATTAEDARRARAIENILCSRTTEMPRSLTGDQRDFIASLAKRGLVRQAGRTLGLAEEALPYARVIASIFDGYRPVTSGTFSAAV